jgi:hypothetical protein
MEFVGTHYTASITTTDFDFEDFLFEASGWVGDGGAEEGAEYIAANPIPAYFVHASGDVRPSPKANAKSVDAFVRRTFEVSESWRVAGYKDKPVVAATSVTKITA